MLGTLEIRAWCRAVICGSFGAQAAGLGGVFSWGLLASCVLTDFASAFTAVAAVAVTRAAFAALTVFGGAGAFGCGVAVCRLGGSQGRFRRAGFGGFAWAAFRSLTTFTTFTAAFTCALTPALATFAASFTAFTWCALCAHFAAFGAQLGLCIAAAFAQAVRALAFGQVFAARA